MTNLTDTNLDTSTFKPRSPGILKPTSSTPRKLTESFSFQAANDDVERLSREEKATRDAITEERAIEMAQCGENLPFKSLFGERNEDELGKFEENFVMRTSKLEDFAERRYDNGLVKGLGKEEEEQRFQKQLLKIEEMTHHQAVNQSQHRVTSNQQSSNQYPYNQQSSSQHPSNQQSSSQHPSNQQSSSQHPFNQQSSSQHLSNQQSSKHQQSPNQQFFNQQSPNQHNQQSQNNNLTQDPHLAQRLQTLTNSNTPPPTNH